MGVPRNEECERFAKLAAAEIRKKFKIGRNVTPRVGLALGTGLDEAVSLEQEERVPFSEVSPIFKSLKPIHGHALEIAFGFIRDGHSLFIPIIALHGRVHMNAKPWNDQETVLQVRLQTEMLFQLGVRRLITTCAAGGVTDNVKTSDIALIDGFFDLLNRLPLFGNEFITTDTAIDLENLERLSKQAGPEYMKATGHRVHFGGHAVVPGPQIEGVRYGKPFFKSIPDILSIGMGSVVADAAIACLYSDEAVKVLPISFITDGNDEVCTHEGNVAVGKKAAPDFGRFLRAGILIAATAAGV